MYLFTRTTLGWAMEEYVTLKVVRKSLGIGILMLLLPALKRLGISDINLLIACNLLNGLGFLLASLSSFSALLIYVGRNIQFE